MNYPKFTAALTVMLLIILLSPQVFASPVSVSISPTNQAVPQGSGATYTVSLSAASATSFQLGVSGLYGAGSFSPNPVPTPPGMGTGSGTSTLSVSATGSPGSGLYCPGVYPFTVSATNVTDGPLQSTPGGGSPPGAPNPETGSALATLTIIQVGPPLTVAVATDKSTYTVGDTVTILLSANRPAEGRLTISPPSGPPQIFPASMIYGTYSLSKTLTANSIGHWTISFQADDFCAGVSSAQASFDVSPNTYDVSVSLNGVPPQYSAQLQVDGQPQGTVGGGEIKQLSFKISTSHTIAVDQYVSGDTGVRYYCAQNTLSVTSTGSLTFNYQTQYQFTVETTPTGVAQVTGSGWFPSGTTVQTNQAPQSVPGGPGTQYAFKGWQINGAAQSGNPVTLTLDKPYTASAQYTTQYQLVVDSPYGNPQGTGYYDAGSIAQFSVTTPVGFPIQQNFVQWTGDYTGTSPQGSITMDKPHTVQAVWSTSYLPLIAIIVVAAAIIGGVMLARRRRRPKPETKPAPKSTSEETGGTSESIKCAKCGNENSTAEKFCTNCGEKLSLGGAK